MKTFREIFLFIIHISIFAKSEIQEEEDKYINDRHIFLVIYF